ncbi:hypothetical protein EYF80_056876 [Liparis tanakae]|uniref:Uncharacterized protein n=1 Tax=Liparis tanakae TaxID=230148 RepID=A0A4Z2EVW7_9TELE|nr:hypothetical protein EYF80_056876 [Liparis tanakae]
MTHGLISGDIRVAWIGKGPTQGKRKGRGREEEEEEEEEDWGKRKMLRRSRVGMIIQNFKKRS